MSEIAVNEVDSPLGETPKDLTRRGFIGGLLAFTGTAVAGALPQTAEAGVERISQPKVVEIPNHNMPEGFSRSRIEANVSGASKPIGSIIFLDDGRAKAAFASKSLHPQYFDAQGRPDFDAIQGAYKGKGDKVAFIGAGAYYNDAHQTQGIALEKGKMVGENQPSAQNGILVIHNGVPRIEYKSERPELLIPTGDEGVSMFQQTSYIRPGGTFTSDKNDFLSLRFFVEGQGKKALINLSEPMTYTEAVRVLQTLAGFTIEKAVGLDMGPVSEGKFYYSDGGSYSLIDKTFGTSGHGYTNVFVLYSDL